MKKSFYTFLVLLLPFFATAQTQERVLDSLHLALKMAPNDTIQMVTHSKFVDYYMESNNDSALYYNEKQLKLTKKLKQPLFTSRALITRAYLVQKEGNFPLAFRLNNASMSISKDVKQEENPHINYNLWKEKDPRKIRLRILVSGYHSLGVIYANVGNVDKSIENYKEAIRIGEEINDYNVNSNGDIGQIYLMQNNLDSAWHYTTKAIKNSNISGYKIYQGGMLNNLGTIFFKRQQLDSANYYYRRALIVSDEQNNVPGKIWANISLAKLYEKKSEADSMYYHATKAYTISKELKEPGGVAYSSEYLSNAFKMQGNADSAFTYLAMSKRIGDSLRTARETNLTEFLNMGFEEQMLREKAVQENIAFKNKIKTIGLFAGLGLLASLAFIFFRNNRQKQKKNAVLENTLRDLKSTQTQLIQAEKMASLGELTAGIAHEIQNPLNFVNNFADVSDEMMDELKEELAKGDISEATILADDVKANLQKITHHGKRADAIVKGMLAHSRAGSSEKQMTDINALADEYLRLSYHGIRAKNKNFNSDFKTDFAKNLPKLNLASQDIGRVLLNLFNNAFYAVQEKAEKEAVLAAKLYTEHTYGSLTNVVVAPPYAPKVKVTTYRENDKVVLRVSDNANGIPSAIQEKIFQPFFTTKPTGEGTGLGLSLSYDIIKAHGGEIQVESKEGEGTTFTIELPLA